MACDALWGTGFSREELAGVAASLGSDVPFLVLGGTALATGRGEQVSPVLAPGHAWHWVVALADGGLATPDVYQELDRLREAGQAPKSAGSTDEILAALRQRDATVLAKSLVNDLEAAAVSLRPSIRPALDAGSAETTYVDATDERPPASSPDWSPARARRVSSSAVTPPAPSRSRRH